MPLLRCKKGIQEKEIFLEVAFFPVIKGVNAKKGEQTIGSNTNSRRGHREDLCVGVRWGGLSLKDPPWGLSVRWAKMPQGEEEKWGGGGGGGGGGGRAEGGGSGKEVGAAGRAGTRMGQWDWEPVCGAWMSLRLNINSPPFSPLPRIQHAPLHVLRRRVA